MSGLDGLDYYYLGLLVIGIGGLIVAKVVQLRRGGPSVQAMTERNESAAGPPMRADAEKEEKP